MKLFTKKAAKKICMHIRSQDNNNTSQHNRAHKNGRAKLQTKWPAIARNCLHKLFPKIHRYIITQNDRSEIKDHATELKKKSSQKKSLPTHSHNNE